MSRAECKMQAKEILRGKWGMAFVVILIYGIIISAVSQFTLGIGTLLFTSMFIIGVYNVFINAYIGKGYSVNDMFDKMGDNLGNKISLSVLKNIFIMLWSMLFVIPGIIKSYSYYVSEFVHMQHPEKSANDCITESRKLMDGHKWDLFIFDLSFIGWHLLAMCTFGILYIWLAPYMVQAKIIYIDKNILKITPKEEVVEAEAEEVKEENKTCKYCSYCGKQLSLDARFCEGCGAQQE